MYIDTSVLSMCSPFTRFYIAYTRFLIQCTIPISLTPPCITHISMGLTIQAKNWAKADCYSSHRLRRHYRTLRKTVSELPYIYIYTYTCSNSYMLYMGACVEQWGVLTRLLYTYSSPFMLCMGTCVKLCSVLPWNVWSTGGKWSPHYIFMAFLTFWIHNITFSSINHY